MTGMTWWNPMSPGSYLMEGKFTFAYVSEVAPAATVLAVLLVTAKQFIGMPINCIVGSTVTTPIETINNFCWGMGKFTL